MTIPASCAFRHTLSPARWLRVFAADADALERAAKIVVVPGPGGGTLRFAVHDVARLTFVAGDGLSLRLVSAPAEYRWHGAAAAAVFYTVHMAVEWTFLALDRQARRGKAKQPEP